MALVWNAFGVAGAVAGSIAIVLAGVAIAAGSSRDINRRLALVLAIDGWAALWTTGLLYLTDDPRTAFAAQSTGIIGLIVLPIASLYLFETLDTPLTRWLKPRASKFGLAVAAAILAVLALLVPGTFNGGVAPGAYTRWDGVVTRGFELMALLGLVVSAFGLVASLHARGRAKTREARRRATWFAVAFGTRDAAYILIVVLFIGFDVEVVGILPSFLLYIPFLVYGVLKAQLFDIDLKIKWTIRRGTLVGAFVVVFVVVAEVAQNYLSDVYGYLAGGVAAGALLLAVRPLDRLSSRVADAAMPHVQPTSDYLTYRKMEVYRAAIEAAAQDGEISAKERGMLASLRRSLGIGDEDASAMERDLLASG